MILKQTQEKVLPSKAGKIIRHAQLQSIAPNIEKGRLFLLRAKLFESCTRNHFFNF